MAKVNPKLNKKSLSPEMLVQLRKESEKYDPFGGYTGSSVTGDPPSSEPQQDSDDI